MTDVIDDATRRSWRELAHWELSGYSDAKAEIRAALVQYEAIRTKAERSVGSIRAEQTRQTVRQNKLDMPVSVTLDVQQQGDPKQIEELMTILADQGNVVRQRQIDAERRCSTLSALIQTRTSGIHARILAAYYLYGRTLEQIAVRESLSYPHIKRLRWRALEVYGEKMIPHDPLTCDNLPV